MIGMDRQEAKRKLTEQVEFYRELGNEIYQCDLNFDIDFSLRGTTAGQACYSKNKIRLNLTAINVEGGWEHLYNQTCPHEVAHMFQYMSRRFPLDRNINAPHGIYWERIMRDFGVRAERCHSIPLKKAHTVQRGFIYNCNCREHNLTKIKHNKIRKGVKYYCKYCRGSLRVKNIPTSSKFSLEY